MANTQKRCPGAQKTLSQDDADEGLRHNIAGGKVSEKIGNRSVECKVSEIFDVILSENKKRASQKLIRTHPK